MNKNCVTRTTGVINQLLWIDFRQPMFSFPHELTINLEPSLHGFIDHHSMQRGVTLNHLIHNVTNVLYPFLIAIRLSRQIHVYHISNVPVFNVVIQQNIY